MSIAIDDVGVSFCNAFGLLKPAFSNANLEGKEVSKVGFVRMSHISIRAMLRSVHIDGLWDMSIHGAEGTK